MKIRLFHHADHAACLKIFDSNFPRYFDVDERAPFEKWLSHQADAENPYSSPTYQNVDKEVYYVAEDLNGEIVGCGGFYVIKAQKEARLAWGMIHSGKHGTGIGTALFQHRANAIRKEWPGFQITLGTSQHTYPFYEKMGMKVVQMISKGYGPDLDRYDMVL